MIFIFICGIIVLVALILLIFLLKKKKLSIYDIKIKEAEQEIDALLSKKLSLLSDLYTHFNENSDKEFQFLCHLDEVEDDEFKLNSILNKAYKELKDYLDDNRSYIPSDDVKLLINDLFQCDIECTAVKNYYNDTINKYNKTIHKLSNKIVSQFMGLQKKEAYNDPVEEEFEILKKK